MTTKGPGDQWYFAYGSNLFIDQKEERTGRIRQAMRCHLPGFRFAFNKQGNGGQIYANIVQDKASEVWGVCYLCDPEAIQKMDRFEGVAGGHYEQISVAVENDAGEVLDALTYLAGEEFVCEPGMPSAKYLNTIISGARHHALPDGYIAQIERLAT